MDQPMFVTLALFGSAILALSLFGGVIKNRLFVSEPALALIFGVVVGPQVFGLLTFHSQGETSWWVEHLARVTVAIALLDIATTLPKGYLRRYAAGILLMLLVVMPLMCATAAAFAWLILGLPLLSALLIGAVVTPTDPVISSAIVSGTLARRAIPARVRHLILAESGLNDALAFALVMLPILLITREAREAWTTWLLVVLLWEVAAAAAIGLVAGLLAGAALRRVQRWTSSEQSSLLTVSTTLAIAVLGVVKLLHGEGLIAVFAAGRMLNRYVGDELRVTKSHVHEAARRLFELPIFIVIGGILPWNAWQALGWREAAFAIAVVLLRRLPAVLFVYRRLRPIRDIREALFVGWFGPIGIATLLYVTLAEEQTYLASVWPAASLAIAISVLAHGCSATPLTQLFYSRARAHE